MADREIPTPETLRQLLRYEPETGKLFWRCRPMEMFASTSRAKAWNGQWADKEAFTSLNSHGYKQGKIWGRKLKGHRVAWAVCLGEWPSLPIDHINGDRSDNRVANMRLATTVENGQNTKRPRTNTSGQVGVSFNRAARKWRAYIGQGAGSYIGQFESFEEAVGARILAEKRAGYHENHGRQ